MSITVPTADGRTGTTPRPDPSGPRWVRGVVIAAVVALVVTMLGGEDTVTSPSTGPVDPAPAQTAGGSSPEPMPAAGLAEDWFRTSFPGVGAFTGLAVSLHGAVAVGQSSLPGGDPIVWATRGAEWTTREIGGGPGVVVRDVASYLDGFVVAGAIVEPGSGTSVPTLWFGTADSDFTVLDQPFEGPGRVDEVRVIAGELVLVGQAAGPFSDNLRPGTARFGRLLTGQPGRWTDITPPGSSVLVTEVVGVGDGLVAVGADSRGPVAWWRGDGATEWTTGPIAWPEAAAVVDVLDHPDLGIVALVRTWDDRQNPRAVLFAARLPGEWRQLGQPLRRDVGWIEAIPGGVQGGAWDSLGPSESSSTVWTFRPDTDWLPIRIDGDAQQNLATELRGAAGGMVYGSTAGQPAVWSTDSRFPGRTVQRPASGTGWEPTAPLPVAGLELVDTGRHLIGFGSDSPAVWLATDGTDWLPASVDGAFRPHGAGSTESGAVVWGKVVNDSIIYDVADHGNGIATHTLPATSVRHVSGQVPLRWILADGPAGSTRIEFDAPGGLITTSIPPLPARVVEHAGMLIGFDHVRPVLDLRFSLDRGDSWHAIDMPVFTVGTAADRIVIVGTDGRLFAIGPRSVEPVEVRFPGTLEFDASNSFDRFLTTWADGVFAPGPSVLRVGQDLAGEVVEVPVDPASGMFGVFVDPVPGPRGFARVSEAGEEWLYRWGGGQTGAGG